MSYDLPSMCNEFQILTLSARQRKASSVDIIVASSIRGGRCTGVVLSVLESLAEDGSAARSAASVHSIRAVTAAGEPE